MQGDLSETPVPEEMPVGEGPLYALMRAEAAKLVPLFAPGGVQNCGSWWGAGICDVVREEGGTNRVFIGTLGRETRPFGVNWQESVERIRATAISLLVYCEAYDGES